MSDSCLLDLVYQPRFPDSSAGKESTCNAGDPDLIPGLGRSAGKGIGYPLQYSGLENSMDCVIHAVTKSQTQLSDFHFHFISHIHYQDYDTEGISVILQKSKKVKFRAFLATNSQ